MSVAVACFEYEGNSLSQKIDGKENFKSNTLAYGKSLLEICKNQDIAINGSINIFKKYNYNVIPILIAKAGSGGKVKKEFYFEIKNQILERIKEVLPLQGIFLALHGAMICYELSDPEGDLLQSIRELVGNEIPIAASLDLHAHVTNKMVDNANILVGYETYPHEDAYSTGKKAANLLVKTIKGEIKPKMSLQKLHAIFPVLGGSTNPSFPMFKIREQAREYEKNKNVLSISYFPVQPWLDFNDVGVTALAITNNNFLLASTISKKLTKEMWKRRDQFEIKSYLPEEASKKAVSMDFKTIILVDAEDSIGGGSGGDSPSILMALVKQNSLYTSVIYIVDPLAVKKACSIGINNDSYFNIGGYQDKKYHSPFHMKARVESIHRGEFIYEGGPLAGLKGVLGPSVILRKNNIQILITTNAVYEHLDEHYKCCNINFKEKKLAVFKNLMNFRKLLNKEISHIIVNGNGSTPLKLNKVKWTNRTTPFWPQNKFKTIPYMKYSS